MDTNIYQEALECWGIKDQLMMLAEESTELATAALHVRRGRKEKDNLAEEAADVEIMLSQLRQVPGMPDAIDDWKLKKLIRLRRTIDMQTGAWKVTTNDAAALLSPSHIRYVCQCGQSVQVQTLGDGYDAVLEISCPSCKSRMRPEVSDDQG
ncbi:MAG: hypothetical protein M0P69_16940 [Bacteroidales bacterium]|nr:hypothetical protein [Bacteroidales bacterium]